MSKMIQIRDVPDRVHAVLKARAAEENMNLSDFIKRELERSTELPTLREWLQRAKDLKPLASKRDPADVIRDLRDSR